MILKLFIVLESEMVLMRLNLPYVLQGYRRVITWLSLLIRPTQRLRQF